MAVTPPIPVVLTTAELEDLTQSAYVAWRDRLSDTAAATHPVAFAAAPAYVQRMMRERVADQTPAIVRILLARETVGEGR